MRRVSIALLFIFAGMAAAHAASEPQILWGVSDSGLEFGRGVIAERNYSVPDPRYYLAHGVGLIRIPFQIGRIQPTARGPLAPDIVSDLEKIIDEDHAAGAITVLDPHGYGFYNIDGKPHDILTDPAAAADYVDLMRRIAVTFGHDDVAIGLMNEPHAGDDADYGKIWNQAIAAIRQAGFRGVILVPHAHWSSAADITPRTPFSGNIVDPDHNWVLELHSYLDPDDTGTYRKPVGSSTIGAERLARAIAWSRQSGVRLFLGETGAPPDEAGLAAFRTMLAEISSAPDAFWGVAVWGAGAWWKPDYPMRLDPIAGVARPQFVALENVMTPEILYFAKASGGPDIPVSIDIDGKKIGPAVMITAARSGPPQAVPVRLPLSPGLHVVHVQPAATAGGNTLYLVDSTWKGASDSGDSFGVVRRAGYSFRVEVPASQPKDLHHSGQ
ncbi:MAG TPA: cellulase family glycosylhydrolase [Acidocella sp.]|jgi:endoglucanase|uniref:glycoside hydrolase family 5 protein n=1 Tax=Acidocella sp. TaxID=50710 RepID=UPI002BB37252|nr:cellulase family glycosylhydrolase [Acidocella sp.]HVE21405.1 cellulase family glycosylhydrolase [Acidocella sp.]